VFAQGGFGPLAFFRRTEIAVLPLFQILKQSLGKLPRPGSTGRIQSYV
jgi:hypothetical protein